MNSLRMSFWMVPDSCAAGPPAPLPPRCEGHHRDDGTVHGHRDAHLVERDSIEQDAHVGDAVDGDSGHAHVPGNPGMVGVVPAVGGEVECDGQALLACGKVPSVEGVGLLGRREASVLADCPRTHAVHRAVRTAQEWGTPGQVSRCCTPARSAAVCRRGRAMPSVDQTEPRSTSPDGAGPAPDAVQSSVEKSGIRLMTAPPPSGGHPRRPPGRPHRGKASTSAARNSASSPPGRPARMTRAAPDCRSACATVAPWLAMRASDVQMQTCPHPLSWNALVAAAESRVHRRPRSRCHRHSTVRPGRTCRVFRKRTEGRQKDLGRGLPAMWASLASRRASHPAPSGWGTRGETVTPAVGASVAAGGAEGRVGRSSRMSGNALTPTMLDFRGPRPSGAQQRGEQAGLGGLDSFHGTETAGCLERLQRRPGLLGKTAGERSRVQLPPAGSTG